MLSKEELLKNYESLRKYWIKNASEEVLSEASKCNIKWGFISTEKALLKESKRFALISKIGHIVRDCEDYEKRIDEIVEELKDKWAELWGKSFARFEKEACHWKREGYESKEEYKEYLDETICDLYDWNSKNAYEASIIENQLGDIGKITKEYYELYL